MQFDFVTMENDDKCTIAGCNKCSNVYIMKRNNNDNT